MRRVILVALLFAPFVAAAAPNTLDELADLVLVYINAGIGIALIMGIVVYFYGVTSGLHKTMTGDSKDMRTQILWGIIALFVMFSVWGITALLRNTLFGGGAVDPFSSGDQNFECDSLDDCVLGGQE